MCAFFSQDSYLECSELAQDEQTVSGSGEGHVQSLTTSNKPKIQIKSIIKDG